MSVLYAGPQTMGSHLEDREEDQGAAREGRVKRVQHHTPLSQSVAVLQLPELQGPVVAARMRWEVGKEERQGAEEVRLERDVEVREAAQRLGVVRAEELPGLVRRSSEPAAG